MLLNAVDSWGITEPDKHHPRLEMRLSDIRQHRECLVAYASNAIGNPL